MSSKQHKDLIQGSDEWKEWRMDKIGASDAVIIMGLGYITPLELYNQKKGLTPPSYVSAAMQRGSDLEEEARQWYIDQVEIEMKPTVTVCTQYPFLHASLDGIDSFSQKAVEIKCPGFNKLKLIKSGWYPEYIIQVQHQYLVNPYLDSIDICIYQGREHKVFEDKGIIIPVARDDEYIYKEMLPKLLDFYECLKNNTPPGEPKAEVVYEEMDSPSWTDIIEPLRQCRARLKDEQLLEKSILSHLKEMAKGSNCRGYGMTLTHTRVQGRVDYDSIPELKGIDLNAYRKPDTTRITVKLEGDSDE